MVRVITLTSDFGLRDPYVAEMKGAILEVAGDAGPLALVDVTHEVAPQDIVEGALAVQAAAASFPPGTVHVAVVDPGVGGPRRGMAVAAAGQVFVGPDNGLFTPFLAGDGWVAHELAAPAYRRPAVSRTFHGRDVFAPAAAHVVLGVELASFGPRIGDPVRLPWPEARSAAGTIAGTVLHVDRFGNLVTSIPGPPVEALGPGARARIAGRVLPVVGTYTDLAPGRPGALVGSHGRVEIAVREGSAAATLRARRGATVVVSRPASPARSSRRR